MQLKYAKLYKIKLTIIEKVTFSLIGHGQCKNTVCLCIYSNTCFCFIFVKLHTSWNYKRCFEIVFTNY